jgi:hypothetical protein
MNAVRLIKRTAKIVAFLCKLFLVAFLNQILNRLQVACTEAQKSAGKCKKARESTMKCKKA